MQRWIYTHREVPGDVAVTEAALIERSRELLRLAVGAPDLEPAGDGSFLLALEASVASVDLAKQVSVLTGVVRRDGQRVVLPVRWHAEPASWLFPRFEGGFEWDPQTGQLGRLTLSGSYSIPLGPIGALVDASVLRNVAQRTAEHLVAALARELARCTASPTPPRTDVAARSSRGPLHVRDVMTRHPVVLDESLPVRTAALILLSADISGAPVVAANGDLVGVLSEEDLLAKVAEQRYGWRSDSPAAARRASATTAGMACSAPALVTAPDARLSSAARMMLDHGVSRLVVIGRGRLLGMLTRHDVLKALVRDDRELLSVVRGVLAAAGASRVTATVQWGVVTLDGRTRLRSSAWSLRRRIERLDGIVSVDDDALKWDTDDVIPPISALPVL